MKPRIHALMYHDIVSGDPEASGFRGTAAARYKLPWTVFLGHLDRLARSVASPPQVADELVAGGNPDAWSLTFDDGGASMLSVGNELARRRWRGHFFITTGLLGQSGFLDAPGVRELRAMGHVVGSHSVSHPTRMSALPEAELRSEWETSVEALSDLLSEQVRTASVPGGYYTKRVAKAAREAGITVLFTSEPVRKPRSAGRCLVIGRFSVRRDTTAQQAARAAAGHRSRWLQQYIGWNLRKPVKALAGDRYEQLIDRMRTSS